ncbi:hydrolase, TatD family protein [Cardiosporidium cionae]|uniref:Hydrolase, TatD family protein n=1 Tax=Cardiosporidium cionae TaxID=476202 RepID=A0ABQ7JA20_9APIC|nr:hydrolase, TatD family protein [Cardiosporidium cionae]|eukprot:KAF8820853.1 hydrolase, TatD family protein [Cardiosporidium cionae]
MLLKYSPLVSLCHLLAFQPFYLECIVPLHSTELPFIFRRLPSIYPQTFLRSSATLSFCKSSKFLHVLKNSQHQILRRRLCSTAENRSKMEIDYSSILKRHDRKLRFIDIAVNLTDLMFQGLYHSRKKHECDIERVLCRADAAGVKKIIVIGSNLEESRAAISLCRTFSNVYGPSLFATVGVHPTRCEEFEGIKGQGAAEYLQNLKELIASNRDVVAAVGEFGLDFDRTEFCSKQMQLKYFEFQLQLVAEFKLPMLLHMRTAAMPFCDILRRNLITWKDVGGVVHSFTGSYPDSQQLLQLNLSIGINGCSLKTHDNLQVVRSIPLDRLLLETDSPWCEIRPSHAANSLIKTRILDATKAERWEGKQIKARNEPANIVQVAEIVSELKNYSKDFEEFCLRIVHNTETLFPLLSS